MFRQGRYPQNAGNFSRPGGMRRARRSGMIWGDVRPSRNRTDAPKPGGRLHTEGNRPGQSRPVDRLLPLAGMLRDALRQ